jgi:microcin C transport system permease protein
MTAYIVRRLILIVPTLVGILTLTFVIVQFAPGGPVERAIAQMQGLGNDISMRFSGSSDQSATTGAQDTGGTTTYRGAQGVDPKYVKELEKQFGFDKPVYVRYAQMLWNFARFDLGKSFYREEPVLKIVLSKLPVSISLGLWTTLITYIVSIPLGIAKAVRDGSRFDMWTSGVIFVGYAIPSFLFAVLLIVLFAGGSYWQIFPLRGLVSDNWSQLSFFGKIGDYFWHIALPITAMVMGGFASLTMLTKNSFLDEINKLYVMTARAKGLTERRVLIGHVFRNAMLIVIAGFPAAFVGILFTGSIVIETIFSLDGMGYLSFEAILNRDYPIVFGTLYMFSLLGLVLNLVSDITYTLVDPRIDFERRDV